tara:strand:- start:264 stop:494 length:231 start_codon:yes stop_codon:yes gene_type:complete
MPTDVAQNAHASTTTLRNGTVTVSCFPTGASFTIDTSTDPSFVEFDTSLTPTELETLYTAKFDDIAYYNAVDGGSP